MKKDKMPRIDPHASAIKRDKQLKAQLKWLKAHGFRNAGEARKAGISIEEWHYSRRASCLARIKTVQEVTGPQRMKSCSILLSL